MKRIAVWFGAVAVVASGAMVAPVHANTNIVEETWDDVRARVCTEEHGYGVVDCSQQVDPIIAGVVETIRPASDLANETLDSAEATATQLAEDAPGIVEDRVNYVYCWMVDPENPYCRGIIRQ